MSLSEHPGTGHVLVPGVNFGFSYILSFKTKLKQLFELSGQLVSQPNNFPQRADINFTTTFFTETFYITLIISQLEDPWVLRASLWSRGIHTSVEVALWEQLSQLSVILPMIITM